MPKPLTEQQERALIDSIESLPDSIFGRASNLYSAAMGAFPFGELPGGSNVEYPNTELGNAQRDAEVARQKYYHAAHLSAYAQAARAIAGLLDWETLAPLLRNEAERLRQTAKKAGDHAANAAISNRITEDDVIRAELNGERTSSEATE